MTDAKTIREWGIANGLAKPGRGRLSQEVKDAFAAAHGGTQANDSHVHRSTKSEGPPYDYDIPLPLEVEQAPEPEIWRAPKLPTEVVRDENLLYTICEQTGAIVGSDRCGKCTNRVTYCDCPDGPSGPQWLKHSSPAEVYLVKS